MADDVTLPGTGAKVVTDEHATRGHMQLIKIAYSADGDATPVGVDANGIDVDVTRVSGVVPVSDNGGSLTVDDGGTTISIDDGGGAVTVDGTVSISGSVAVADGGGVLSVDDGAGSLTVDGTVTVQDGGGAISVDDNGSTLSVDDGAGSLTVDNAALSVVGGGAEATALRVTIANDSTGVLSVDDNGGALTVDGTVAATQSGTWTVQPGNTANTTAWLVKVNENGLSSHKFRSDNATFATSVTAVSTVLYQARCYNRSTSIEAFLKLYNRADTPDPSAGHTNISIDPISVATAAGQNGGFINNFGTDGLALTTGFGFAVVTGIADTNETPAGTDNVICMFLYRTV